MRKTIVAGNWKMNKTPKEDLELIETLKPLVADNEKTEVVFCPPFVSLLLAVEATKGTNIKIGAQNMYYEESGAYTGEVAPNMIKECGCEYVILGHSERRAYFGETDEIVNKKVLKAFEHDLIPIICVGETLEQRDQGITIDLVRLQTKIALKDVTPENAKKAVIAYEPIWAIGTGRTATSVQAEEVCGAIREVVAEVYGQEVADEIRVQYGGSVNAGNAAELFAMPNIDGGLVGGASLKADFAKIVNY
ncbi:MAG: triose-phosphate isomerase [Firmicutes bacterium]|nr:triose-phosphate isomerase [Bacillota bacterium]